MRTRAALAALVLLAVTVGVRVAVTERPTGGAPEVVPLDDVYHGKRIVEAALGRGLVDFDPGRGPRGAFCPWPPLYDGASALVARVAGAGTPVAVLRVARAVPLVVSGLFVAALVLFGARRFGRLLPALVLGTAVAFAPSFLDESRLGVIDHHFLEPPLASAMALGAALCATAERRDAPAAALLLGLAIAAGLLVQPALLLAAGLAAAALLLFAEAGGARSGAAAFGIATLPVLAYRVTRAPGFPESFWYLGAPHLAALAGAALALGLLALLLSRGVPAWRARLLSISAGGALAVAVPGALWAILEGAGFFGGDPWLDGIMEFQPLLSGGRGPAGALGLIGGGILLAPFLRPARAKDPRTRRTLLVFAAVTALLAIARFRFAILASPFAAACGAVVVNDLLARRRRALAWGAALLATLPALAGALPALAHPEPVVPVFARPAIRVARFLRARPEKGRVLGPWTWGHVLEVSGARPVVLDNFGSSMGARDFAEANEALLATREERLAAYCRRTGVAFVVFSNPLFGLPECATGIGLPRDFYLRRRGASGADAVTHLAQATVWWRAYYARGRAVAGRGRSGEPLRFFAPVYEDAQRSWEPEPFRGPALVVWRFVGP